jgi:hypothetical protein
MQSLAFFFISAILYTLQHDCHQAACTVFKNTPDDGCKGHPKHVECIAEIKKKAKDCIKLVVY